jgi:hypothetical protein
MNEDKNRCVISIENWQFQCCGTPFHVDEKVDWIVHKWGKQSDLTNNIVEFYYEHHSSEWKELYRATGIAEKIEALFCSYELRPNPHGSGNVRYAVNEKYIEVKSADGWDKNIGNLEFNEYEVTLRDCVIRPAKEEEITFS